MTDAENPSPPPTFPLTWISPHLLAEFAGRFVEGLTPPQRMDFFQGRALQAASNADDATTQELLKCIERTSNEDAPSGPLLGALHARRLHVIYAELYWQIFHPLHETEGANLPETRKFLLERIALGINNVPDQQGDSVCAFFHAALGTQERHTGGSAAPSYCVRLASTSIRSRLDAKDRKFVALAFEERMKKLSYDARNAWFLRLKKPFGEGETPLTGLIGKMRSIEGGESLAREDIDREELLRPFGKLRYRSSGARRMLQAEMAKIDAVDEALWKLGFKISDALKGIYPGDNGIRFTRDQPELGHGTFHITVPVAIPSLRFLQSLVDRSPDRLCCADLFKKIVALARAWQHDEDSDHTRIALTITLTGGSEGVTLQEILEPSQT